MRDCVICKNEFQNIGREICCSIKCKILHGIVKQDNGCWIYKSSASGAYGKIRWKMKWYSAHRQSYIAFKGEISRGKWVCHTCDTPKCVNPDHLFEGSASENRRDASNKNRIPIGENNHLSKFSDVQIQEMRSLKKEGFTYSRLSRIFNCSITQLYFVIKEKIRNRK